MGQVTNLSELQLPHSLDPVNTQDTQDVWGTERYTLLSKAHSHSWSIPEV